MTERRNHLLLLGLIVAALVGVGLLAVPGSPLHRKPTLGLDLQGGLEVILKAQAPTNRKLTPDDVNRSVSIMRSRIDKLGVASPEIRKEGADEIVIELAGVHDIQTAVNIIGQTAQLEFYDLSPDLAGPSRPGINGTPGAFPSLYALLARSEPLAKHGTPSAYYLFTPSKTLLAGPNPTRKQLFATPKVHQLLAAHANRLPAGYKVLATPAQTKVITCGATAVLCPGVNQSPPTQTFYYLLRYIPGKYPELTGGDLNASGTRADFDPTTGEPIVLMQFSGKGRKIFHEITRQEARRGALAGQKQEFAIVLDNEIRSFPSIDYTLYPDGIDPTNGAQITGLRDVTEANNLALVLQTGALPVNFVQIERTDVSATLGKDSLSQAKRAALYGLIVVAIFLLVLYRFLGLVAVIGLAIYAAFLYAAILLFHVTLTLPGFAGMILTIGVAADANVVVFERIKEEVRAGKSVRSAISAGYTKGFHTILDANVVTAITALVLFAIATAGVKGFALMLLIGTVISLVTAVAATRAMLGLLAGFRWFDNPRFMGAQGAQGARWLQVDFMRRRYLWFALSGVILLVGVISLATKGLNLGIDFKGGTQMTFSTSKPHAVADVRAVAAADGHRDAVIQGRGSQHNGDIYRSFQVRLRSLTGTEQARFTADLQTKVDASQPNVRNVSASFGQQIARSAIYAIIFSLFLVVIYIAIRFDFKFAVPVILAMIHDVFVAVGIYSVSGREVTESTVAAILTVLGYSIYDTIIIFDRIRENTPLMRTSPYATIANISLWETIRRSLATTFITLLPVASLFAFGGATLKDFAFALLVGIASGAYSSIFIAAPLLTIWKEREPEYARRKALAPGTKEGSIGGPGVGRRARRGTPAVDPGTAELEHATEAAAAEPAPSLSDFVLQPGTSAHAKRERRRQRRARPHGRPR